MAQAELKDLGTGLLLPSGKVISYEEALEDYEKLKKISPISFHDLLPMQQRFKEDQANIKCIFGGNRSGKSEGTADSVVDYARKESKKKIWICGETFQDSIAIQQKKVWDLIPKHEVKYGFYSSINGFTNRKLLFHNGTIITFKSYDQGCDAFQSDDIDLIWNDEECPYDIYKEQRMRLLDRDGKMIISMTSLKGVTDLIETIYSDSDILETKYADLVDEELPRVAEKDGIKFYFLWTQENPHISQGRMAKEAQLMSKQEIKSRFFGIPINLAGRIYPTFSREVHVIKDIEWMPEGRYTLYFILDPHDRKPWAMIWVAVHSSGTAYVIDEWPNKNFNEFIYDVHTYKEYAKIIKDREIYIKDLFGDSVSIRILDPNFGNKTVQLAQRQGGNSTTTPKKMLLKNGLVFRDGIDALEAGHLKVRESLHWEEKDGEIVVQPKLFVLSHCQNTIRHLSRYSRKDIITPDGDVRDSVKPKEKYKDFCDVVRYFEMSGSGYIPIQEEKKEKKVY